MRRHTWGPTRFEAPWEGADKCRTKVCGRCGLKSVTMRDDSVLVGWRTLYQTTNDPFPTIKERPECEEVCPLCNKPITDGEPVYTIPDKAGRFRHYDCYEKTRVDSAKLREDFDKTLSKVRRLLKEL